LKKRKKRAELRSFSDLRKQTIFPSLSLFFISVITKFFLSPFLKPVYDEIAYSSTAQNIVNSGSWFNFYGSDDLFFFPPLFNWFSAILITFGFERLMAVRSVTIILSSGIAPLIYLTLKKSGLDSKSSFIAAIYWIIFPGVTHYSIAGQVETPFLFFVFLSFYLFVNRNIKPTLFLFASALSISSAVWIKETAIGFFPVFLFMMYEKKELKNIVKWSTFSAIFLAPLIVQSFLPHNYDMFFELSNDNITWGSISFIKPFTNIGELAGVTANLPVWLFILLNVVISISLISGAVYCFVKYRHIELIRFSLFSLLVFIPFFALFPKKFHYYLLPVLLLFLICFSFAALKNIKIQFITGIFLFFMAVNGLKDIKSALDMNYLSSSAIISRLAAENLDEQTTVVSATPELMRYIAKHKEIKASFHSIDFTTKKGRKNCLESKDRCILDHDYYITDDMFFEVIFCKTWPIKIENCDVAAMRYVISNTELLLSKGGYRLYRIIK
jgi:4-amino-4-deoxy-L-arabinose transferase-like glycosyltransferase